MGTFMAGHEGIFAVASMTTKDIFLCQVTVNYPTSVVSGKP